MNDPASIDRIAKPSAETFEREYLHRGRPVIIEGAIEDWAGRRAWSFDFWRERYPHKRLPVTVSTGGSRKVVEMSLGSYLDAITDVHYAPAERSYYLQEISFPEHFPELQGDLPAPLVSPEIVRQWLLFIGVESAKTYAHYHPRRQAFLAQLQGHKRVHMYGPEQTHDLYAQGWISGRSNRAAVDLEEPDYTRYPCLRRARGAQVVLNPGDLLFIPIHWWHAVYSLDDSVSVTLFFDSRWRDWKLNRPALSSALRLAYLAVRPRTGLGRALERFRTRLAGRSK